MSDVKRWVDDGAPETVRRMFAAARDEEHGGAGLERALMAVGAGGAAAAGASQAGALGAAKAATKVGLFGVAAKWSAVGAACAIATAGAVHVLSAPRASEEVSGAKVETAQLAVVAPRPIASSVATGGVLAPSAARDEATDAPETTVQQAAVATAAPASPAGTANAVLPSVSAAPSRAAATGDLAGAKTSAAIGEPEASRMMEEVHAIDRARTALTNGDGAGTLALVDAYHASFPGGRFEPEALYLKMEALLRSGDAAGARSTAEQLLARFPHSPQAARAHRVVSDSR